MGAIKYVAKMLGLRVGVPESNILLIRVPVLSSCTNKLLNILCLHLLIRKM